MPCFEIQIFPVINIKLSVWATLELIVFQHYHAIWCINYLEMLCSSWIFQPSVSTNNASVNRKRLLPLGFAGRAIASNDTAWSDSSLEDLSSWSSSSKLEYPTSSTTSRVCRSIMGSPSTRFAGRKVDPFQVTPSILPGFRRLAAGYHL